MLGPGYGYGDGYGRYQSLKYYGSTCTIINNNNVIGARLMTTIHSMDIFLCNLFCRLRMPAIFRFCLRLSL